MALTVFFFTYALFEVIFLFHGISIVEQFDLCSYAMKASKQCVFAQTTPFCVVFDYALLMGSRHGTSILVGWSSW